MFEEDVRRDEGKRSDMRKAQSPGLKVFLFFFFLHRRRFYENWALLSLVSHRHWKHAIGGFEAVRKTGA